MLKNLLDLYITFFKIGAVTFGGGYAMLPVLDRELAQKKKWVSGDDLLDYYAVSQVTPGVIAVNVSTFVGSKQAGIAGGIAATAGVVSPSIIIITVIALFISSFEKIVWVQKALAGVNVAVTALLSYAGFNFAKKAVKNWWGLLIYACSFCAVFFYKIPSVAVVLLALAVGLLIHFVCVGASGKGADGVAKDAGGFTKEADCSAKEAGGVAEGAGGLTKDAGGSTKDAGGSSEEAVAFANRAIGLQKDAIASTEAAPANTAPASTGDALANAAAGSTDDSGGSAKKAGTFTEVSPANTVPGSTKDAGGSAKEAGAFANRAIGLQEDAIASTEYAPANAAPGSTDDSGGSAKEAGCSAEEAGGSPEAAPANTAPASTGEAGGVAKDADCSTKDTGGSSEEAVAFVNRAIGLQKDAIAPTPAASAKVPADLPQKNKSKN